MGFSLIYPNLSQNGRAILATLSTTHHLLYTSSKQSLKCSRKELKMSTDTTAGRERSNFLFFYAGAWCGSDLYVGLVISILTDPTCGGATCTVSTPCRCHGYRTAGVWCQPQMNQPLPPGSPLGTLGGVKRNDRTSSHEVLGRFLEELVRSSLRIRQRRENFGKIWETSNCRSEVKPTCPG